MLSDKLGVTNYLDREHNAINKLGLKWAGDLSTGDVKIYIFYCYPQ